MCGIKLYYLFKRLFIISKTQHDLAHAPCSCGFGSEFSVLCGTTLNNIVERKHQMSAETFELHWNIG